MMFGAPNQLNCCLSFLTFLVLMTGVEAQAPRVTYDMDEKSTCGRRVNVDDSGVRLNGRGNVHPSQPPLLCIVYLQSVYANDDGSNKLQVEVESLQIKDCNVRVELFNGRTSVGNTLKTLSCQYGSAGIFYSTNREITVKFSRLQDLVHNEYQFTLLIKPFKDREVPGTQKGVSSLSVAAIIGIIIGCLLLIALIILFLWCYCTGRLGNLNIPGRSISKGGMDNGAMSYEKSNAEIMKVKDPIEWENTTNVVPNPPRLYQRGRPRNSMSNERRFDNVEEYVNDSEALGVYSRNGSRWNRGPRHDYELYDAEKERAGNQTRQRKETLIDDVFESDTVTKESEVSDGENTVDEETLQKRSVVNEEGSPRSRRKCRGDEVPEAGKLDRNSPQLEQYKSMDLQSQPDQDTISSPHHVNAGVRASVEDIDSLPHGTLNRDRKNGQKSPKSRRRGGKEPDPMAMPPEAFDPIFTTPITGIDYKGSQPSQAYGIPHGYPGYPPYGLVPAGMFAPGLPGTQTYAYAYQTVPPGGMPGQQGAWVVQNTPTTEGNRRTAYVMEETVADGGRRGRHNLTPESKRRGKNQSNPFGQAPYRNSDRYRLGGKSRGDDRGPDMSIIARGAAPPDPGQGHRSVAMKSGTDPDSGIHTTQVVWTDTAPDPSDPKPGENPQVTRKTVTRVITKSGYGDLPPENNPLMVLDGEEEPDVLSPSKGRIGQHKHQAAFLAPALPSMTSAVVRTPDKENVDFYTGPPGGSSLHSTVPPPERASTPQFSVHQHPTYNVAIRDRIPLDDSTV